MAAGEAVVVLVVAAHRRVELSRPAPRMSGIASAEHDAGADRMTGNLASDSSSAASAIGLGAAGRPLELDDRRQRRCRSPGSSSRAAR